jgi:tRNA-uridine 2-sulfurtransferase
MTRAIALFSGGLDSLLAARLVMEQGIEVSALQFITPFFNYKYKGREDEAAEEFRHKFGIDCTIKDVTEEYVRMLRNPRYGYGKNFNPCIDCKIFMMKRALEVMKELSADFLVSGEVLGQRPMSQRRDALRIVERDSGADYYLLRPLCAKLLKPTYPEEHGLIDRERLLDISGRSRKRQLELAEGFGLTGYQTPAGGCLLTDPIISNRVRSFLEDNETLTADDLVLLSLGRHFALGSGMLYVGRNKDENARLASMVREDDLTMKVKDRPGPLSLVRGRPCEDDIELAAGITARYADTSGIEKATVAIFASGKEQTAVNVFPAGEETLEKHRSRY